MNAEAYSKISKLLENARITATSVPAPSKEYPELDVKGAFEVARQTTNEAVKNGDRLVGYKLGNIAKVMQAAFGLDHPDYGFLLASRFAYEGEKVRLDQFIAPFVELEPAFVLSKDLRGPNVTIADVISAIDYAVPAIEIIDSRVTNWAISLEDTLADNGSNGAVILGGAPRKLTDLNLQNIKGWLEFNGKEIVQGNTKNILGHPLAATAWLVNKLSEFNIGFEAGQVILPGSCLEAMPMREKGHWTCTYEDWGSIEFDVV